LSVSVSKLALFGFGLTLHLAAVCGAGETPKILVASFQGVPSASAPQLPNFEARFAAQFEIVAEGRAKALVDANGRSDASLEANDIRLLAGDADATFVLVGEWRPAKASTDGARDLEIALELRSGHSGATEHRYRLVWDSSSQGAEAAEMERVAQAMLQDLQLSPEPAGGAQVAASGDVLDSPTQKNGNHERGKRTDFLTVKRDQPIQINSEQLELLTEGDAKRLIFSDEVQVVQGEMQLFAGHLEAFYPEGASQPEKLKASQNVRMIEGDLEVHCLEATYLRDEGLVICRGNALLVQGCDEVRGKEIVFHLDEERVKINGAASVVLHLEQDDAPACDSGDEG
jgi:lipopolysaccharide export system protein LptA